MLRLTLALAFGFEVIVACTLAAPARADQASTETEMSVPAPTAETPGDPAAEPLEPADVTTQPVAPAAAAPPPLTDEPVEAVHRPGGFWGPLAVAADLLVMRPIGFVSLAVGGAAFVAVSPVAAATGTIGDRADTLLDRAENVFTRPLGAL